MHVGYGCAQVVAHVGAEKAEHALVVIAGHESLAQQHHAVSLLIHLRQTEAAQLLQQAAGMHILGHGLREALETWRSPLPRQGLERRALVPQRGIADPAGEDLGGRRTPWRFWGRGFDQPRNFTAVQSGGGADPADGAVCRHIGVRLAGGLHEGGTHEFIELRVLHASRDRQLGQRGQYGPACAQQQRIVGLVGSTRRGAGVRCGIHVLASLGYLFRVRSVNVLSAHFKSAPHS